MAVTELRTRRVRPHASVLTLRSQVPRWSDSARRITVDLQPATDASRIEGDQMEQTPMWRSRSARWAAVAALLAAGALGGGILGATLSASADPAATPSTQTSSPTQDTDGEQPEWQDTDGEQPE
jgi:hypothetical protein